MEVEKAAFLVSSEGGGEVIRELPFAYMPNIVRKITDLLTHNERYNYKFSHSHL